VIWWPGGQLPPVRQHATRAHNEVTFSHIIKKTRYKTRINVDNLFDKGVLSFISLNVTADGFFWPLSPQTIQFTLSAEF
jgi:hypothetical protein